MRTPKILVFYLVKTIFMPDTEKPSNRSRLGGRLAVVRKGRSPQRLLADLSTLSRQHGVRGLTYRASYEVARMLAPPEPPLPLEDLTATVPFGAANAPYFNLDAATLDANRAVVDAFTARGSDVRTATWFVPHFNHVLFGGISTILRFMNFLTGASRSTTPHRVLRQPHDDRRGRPQ